MVNWRGEEGLFVLDFPSLPTYILFTFSMKERESEKERKREKKVRLKMTNMEKK